MQVLALSIEESGLCVVVTLILDLSSLKVLLSGSSVDMVSFLLNVVLGVANGLVFNCLVGVGTVRALGVAMFEWMGLSVYQFRLTVAVTVMGDTIIMTNSLELGLRVVVGVPSLNVMCLLVDKRSLISVNINSFVNGSHVMSLG